MRRMNLRCVLAIAAIVVGAMPVRADEIKVGVLGSFTGAYADWGKRFQQSIDLFMEQHDKRVGNHQVTVVYRDVGGNNPARAKQLAQELIVRDQVQYLAGLEFTPTVLALAEIITQAKMPFVFFNSATSDVTRKSPYYVRVGFTQWETATAIGAYAAEQGKKKGVIVAADFGPGYDAIDAYTKSFTDKGGKIVDVIKIPLDTPDFSSYIQRAKDDAADAMFVFMPTGPMSVNVLKSYVDRGLRAAGTEFYCSTETEEPALPTVGDAALGVVSALHYGPYLDNPENAVFLKAFQAKYGKDEIPNIASVAAYDGMRVVFHMIEATDGKRDSEKAMAAAKGFSWASPRGPVTIDPKEREIIQNIYMRKVEKIDGALGNRTIFTYHDVKDPWKEAHPE
ncbi:MAG: transporter substrate-binding protein [Rhodospirillales bacterium]|jgi:branched-chain amino acid transport system substrate-binding protein|nr:transporter substrate-binding protein [Rhodospirillales bacterium]